MARPKRELNGEIITTKEIDFTTKIAMLNCLKDVVDRIDYLIENTRPTEEDLKRAEEEQYPDGFYHNYIKEAGLKITFYNSIKQHIYKLV